MSIMTQTRINNNNSHRMTKHGNNNQSSARTVTTGSSVRRIVDMFVLVGIAGVLFVFVEFGSAVDAFALFTSDRLSLLRCRHIKQSLSSLTLFLPIEYPNDNNRRIPLSDVFSRRNHRRIILESKHIISDINDLDERNCNDEPSTPSPLPLPLLLPATTIRRRRDVVASLLNAGGVLPVLYTTSSSINAAFAATASDSSDNDNNDSDNESFASIAKRANKLSKEIDATNPQPSAASSTRQTTTASALSSSSSPGNNDSMLRSTNQTIYDFTLPIAGTATSISEIIRQEFNGNSNDSNKNDVKVKAIIVVNIKQDDPVARKAIPELIALAAKYGRGSNYELAIIACPTDQGYYEPDTSQLLKLKLASEYGYGINPSTVVTDKVNLLGTGAIPLWRWIQNVCRTPSGLGRIQGNYEKFLVDGRTGIPVRRYPRKYRPIQMMDDIEAVIANRPLPPPQAGYLEEWRTAMADSERDTYRFEKGLNVFDQ